MSVGSRINMVAFQLNVMLQDIRQETLKILASGRSKPPQNLENYEFFEKINNWELALKDFERQLSQMEASVEGRQVGNRGGRIEARRHAAYQLRQSLKDQAKHIDRVEQLATEAKRELRRLLRLSVDSTALDIEEDFSDLAKDAIEGIHTFVDALEHVKAAQTLEATTVKEMRTAIQHTYMAGQVGASTDIFGSLTLLVTLLRILWLARIKQVRQRRS